MKLPALRYVRELRGLTQPELGDASGVSLRTIVNEEHGGEARPSTARKLAEALDVSVAVLAGVEEFPTARRVVPARVPLQIAEMLEASHAARRRALEAASADEIELFVAEVAAHKERTEDVMAETAREALAAREDLRSGYESSLRHTSNYAFELGRLYEQASSYLPTHAGLGVGA